MGSFTGVNSERVTGGDKSARPRVLVVSDSLTNEEAGNWFMRWSRMGEGFEPFVEAHGGWSTHSYFREKFDGVAFANVPERFDVLVILIGSNNLFEAGGGSDEAVEEAAAGVERIAAHVLQDREGVEVVLIAPPTVVPARGGDAPDAARRLDATSPGYLRKLGERYRALATRRGWRFVDLFPVLDENDFSDAAHPHDEGNRKVAEHVWEELHRQVTAQPRPEGRGPRGAASLRNVVD